MKQSIKKINQSTKILEIYAECKMQNSQNAKFVDVTQTSIFYIQDFFQSIFLTSTQPQITQERIKSHQRTNFLIFLSF